MTKNKTHQFDTQLSFRKEWSKHIWVMQKIHNSKMPKFYNTKDTT